MNKSNSKIGAIFVVLISQILSFNVQAQTWTVPIYGCLQGRNSSQAVINKKDVLVKTNTSLSNDDLVFIITELERLFSVTVPVYFPNDNLNNAFFTPYKFIELVKEDGGDIEESLTGTIFISEGLLRKESKENYGSFESVPAVMAHEYAHAKQYKNNFPYKATLWRELHADFMAGWFTAHLCRCGILHDPRPSFTSFYNKGTDQGFFDLGHHGTKDQRVAAMYAGYMSNFQLNDASGTNAYNAGLQYVKNLGAK